MDVAISSEGLAKVQASPMGQAWFDASGREAMRIAFGMALESSAIETFVRFKRELGEDEARRIMPRAAKAYDRIPMVD